MPSQPRHFHVVELEVVAMELCVLRGLKITAITLALLPGIFCSDTAAGDPLFAAPFLSSDTGSYPISVAIGDLNGDGKSDLALANANSSTISVLLGAGNGTFGPKSDYGTGS